MKKSLWYWTKDDVQSYIRKNIKGETEFSCEALYKKITGYNFFGYGDRNLNHWLLELLKEGYLISRFESIRMNPIKIDNNSVTSTAQSKFINRFGSKTIQIFKIKNNE